MLLVQMTLLMAMATFGSAQPPPLLDDRNSKFYDSFGDETSLACDGCYVVIRCDANTNPCTETKDSYYQLIDPNNKTVANDSCDPATTKKSAYLRLDINENTTLGPYRCKYGDRISEEAQNLLYRLCSKKNRDFMKGSCNDNDFCFIAGNPEKATCDALDATLCLDTHKDRKYRFCGSNVDSLCEAFTEPQKPTTKMDKCFGTEYPNVHYPADKMHLYNAAIQMDRNLTEPSKFEFSFRHSAVPSNLTCTIEDRNSTVIDHQSKVVNGPDFLVFNEDIFNHGTQLLKLECMFVNGTAIVAWLSNYLVIQVPGKVNITVITEDNLNKTLMCWQEEEPPEGFFDVYTWTDENEQIRDGQELVVTQSGNVTCRVDRVFMFPGPYRLYRMNEPSWATLEVIIEPPETTSETTTEEWSLLTNATTDEVPLTTATTEGLPPAIATTDGTGGPGGIQNPNNEPMTTGAPKGGTPAWLKALIGIIFGVVFIALIVIVVLVRKQRSTAGSPKSEMLHQGKESLARMSKRARALDLVRLQEWCEKRKKHASDKRLDKEVAEVDKKAQKNEQRQVTKNVPQSRVDKVALTFNQIVVPMVEVVEGVAKLVHIPLHLNRMSDKRGNELLLGMAPTPKQIVPYWAVIYKAKVGVLVWVGNTKELDWETGQEKVNIDEYVPLKEDETMTFDNEKGTSVQVKATRVIATDSVKLVSVDTDMRTTPSKFVKNAKGQTDTTPVNRWHKLSLVYVRKWTEDSPPDDPKDVAHAVKLVDRMQMKHAKKGMPGVMMHCSDGLQRSPAMAICYLGYQMWKETGHVDPLGLMEYVREHRALALALSCMPAEKVNMLMGVVADVLKLVCTKETAGKRKKGVSSKKSLVHV